MSEVIWSAEASGARLRFGLASVGTPGEIQSAVAAPLCRRTPHFALQTLLIEYCAMVGALYADTPLHESFNVKGHAFSFRLPNKLPVNLENL